MTRLTLIRAEITEITHRLHRLEKDARFHPWLSDDQKEEQRKMRNRLTDLRLQEFIIANHSPIQTDRIPLHRENHKPEEDVDFVVALLVCVAFLGVITAMLLNAAGVLS